MKKSSNRLWSRSLDLCNCPLHTSGLLHSHGGSRNHPGHFSHINMILRSYANALGSYLILATRASWCAATIITMALMNPAMMSQSMDKLHGHHTRVGHRVGREGGAKGMVTKTNWGKA